MGADGKLYLASEEGDVIVLKIGEKYEALAVNSHRDQIFISSPVTVDNEIFGRGSTVLYAVSNQDAQWSAEICESNVNLESGASPQGRDRHPPATLPSAKR